MVIVMLGAPGTGKGTIAKLISQYYEIPHISTGDILREFIANSKSQLSKQIKEKMEKGDLIDDESMIKIVEDRIKKIDCENGFILDGFPRTINQANALLQMLKKNKQTLDIVLNLQTPEDEIIQRITNRIVCPNCKAIYNKIGQKPVTEGICDICDTPLITRKDDTKEKIVERLKEYHEKTYPLIDYYQRTGKLFDVIVSERLNRVGKQILKEIIWFVEKQGYTKIG